MISIKIFGEEWKKRVFERKLEILISRSHGKIGM